MSRESIVSVDSTEAHKIINQVRGNVPFLDKNDIEILRFLSKKGLFEKQKVKLVPKKD